MSNNLPNSYVVIGLFICGNLSLQLGTGLGATGMSPVPHFAGDSLLKNPLEGRFCLKVDHSSHRVACDEGYNLSCFNK